MMQKTTFTVLLSVFLFGCATSEKYDHKLSSLLGKNPSVLTKEFGTPSAKRILDNGDEVVTFTSVNNTYVPDDFYLYQEYSLQGNASIYAPFDGDYDFTPFAQNFNQLPEYTCQTSFWIHNNKISGWKWKGNNCISQ